MYGNSASLKLSNLQRAFLKLFDTSGNSVKNNNFLEELSKVIFVKFHIKFANLREIIIELCTGITFFIMNGTDLTYEN